MTIYLLIFQFVYHEWSQLDFIRNELLNQLFLSLPLLLSWLVAITKHLPDVTQGTKSLLGYSTWWKETCGSRILRQWANFVHSQEGEREEYWCSVCFLFSDSWRSQNMEWCHPQLNWTPILTLIILHRHCQRPVSQMGLALFKLMVLYIMLSMNFNNPMY